MIKNNFDDYLNLLNYDFSNYKYIIFLWKSWAWKTSYINELTLKNKSLKNNYKKIDEIFNFIDFVKYFSTFLNKSNNYLIASHISPTYFYFFKIFWKIKVINLDNDFWKIKNYLINNNYTFSDKTINDFIKNYKSNYTDLEIILENYTWNNFDESYANFNKFNKIKLVWERNR